MRTLRKLSPKQAEKIREGLPDHPLYQVCQVAFRHFMAELKSFDFTTEDLFVAVVYVIDDLIEGHRGDLSSDYIDSLWDNLKIGLKSLNKTAPPQEDLNVVCNVLFYVVVAAFRLHWNGYFKDVLAIRLRDVVRLNGNPIPEKELDGMVARISECAESLEEWINDYIEYFDCLSGKIDAMITSSRKLTQFGGKDTFVASSATFKKNGTLTDGNITIFYQNLIKKKWIAQETSVDDFLKLFSGKTSYVKIYWTRTAAGVLKELFKAILDKKLITCPKGVGYQKILSSHFISHDGMHILNLNKGYKGKKVTTEIQELVELLNKVVLREDTEDV